MTTKEKIKFINEHTKYFSITLLCETIGITRSNYYRYLQTKTSLIKVDEGIITLIQNEKLNNKFLNSYGIRRWKIYLFKKLNLVINKKRLQRIFKEHGIIPFYWKNRSRHIKKSLS